MSKHTPGLYSVRVLENKRRVAESRLIDAAPDLLAACMAEQLAIVYDDNPGSHEASEAIRELMALGYAEDSDKTPGEFASSLRRIAISKATGDA